MTSSSYEYRIDLETLPDIGEHPNQPAKFSFQKRAFGINSVVYRSFQPQWFQKWSWIHPGMFILGIWACAWGATVAGDGIGLTTPKLLPTGLRVLFLQRHIAIGKLRVCVLSSTTSFGILRSELQTGDSPQPEAAAAGTIQKGFSLLC